MSVKRIITHSICTSTHARWCQPLVASCYELPRIRNVWGPRRENVSSGPAVALESTSPSVKILMGVYTPLQRSWIIPCIARRYSCYGSRPFVKTRDPVEHHAAMYRHWSEDEELHFYWSSRSASSIWNSTLRSIQHCS